MRNCYSSQRNKRQRTFHAEVELFEDLKDGVAIQGHLGLHTLQQLRVSNRQDGENHKIKQIMCFFHNKSTKLSEPFISRYLWMSQLLLELFQEIVSQFSALVQHSLEGVFDIWREIMLNLRHALQKGRF